MLEKIKATLSPQQKEKVDLSLKLGSSSIEPIEPKEAEKELGIVELATKDASSGIPLRTGIFPSQSEADIRRYVSDRVNGFIDWAIARLKFSNATLNKTGIRTTIALNLQNAVQKFEEQDLKTWTSDYASDLNHTGKLWKDAQTDLENFRKENHLTEPPRNKTSSQKLTHVTIMVVLILVEAAINASLLATGLSGGLAQGASMALVLAAFNIAISFWVFGDKLGRFIRCKTLRLQSAGILGILAWILFEIHFSFGVAHYREALEAFAATDFTANISPATAAINNLYTPLGDFWSWVLCFITLGFGFLAFLEGIFWQEPQPHYTRKYELEEKTREDYTACFDEALENLNNIKNNTIKDIKDAMTKIESDYSAFSIAIQDKANDEITFSCAFAGSRIAYQAMIKMYQDTNLRHRTEEQKGLIPDYFGKEVDVTTDPIWARQLPNFETDTDSQRLQEQAELKAMVSDQLEQLITRVHTASADALAPFKLKSFNEE